MQPQQRRSSTTALPSFPSREPDRFQHSDARDQGFRDEALPHLDTIYRFALRLTADETRAEDLVQETFLKAYKSWHQYTPGTNCRSWLFTICRNLHVRAEEQKSRHRQLLQEKASVNERDSARPLGPLARSPVPTPEKLFFHPRIDDILLEKINELPPEYREAVILSDIEEMSYKEIAEIVGVPVGTVRSRLSRGRRILRDEFRDYAVENGFLRPNQAPPSP